MPRLASARPCSRSTRTPRSRCSAGAHSRERQPRGRPQRQRVDGQRRRLQHAVERQHRALREAGDHQRQARRALAQRARGRVHRVRARARARAGGCRAGRPGRPRRRAARAASSTGHQARPPPGAFDRARTAAPPARAASATPRWARAAPGVMSRPCSSITRRARRAGGLDPYGGRGCAGSRAASCGSREHCMPPAGRRLSRPGTASPRARAPSRRRRPPARRSRWPCRWSRGAAASSSAGPRCWSGRRRPAC